MLHSHDIPGHRPDNDRQQLAALGTVPTPAVEPNSDNITVQRAEWDALLSRIAALESRVDDAERVARKTGPRFEALRRRDRLRGGR